MPDLRDYIHDGPHAEGADTFSKRTVGLWLHWETWAVIFILLASLLALQTVAPGEFTAWSIGPLTATVLSRLPHWGTP